MESTCDQMGNYTAPWAYKDSVPFANNAADEKLSRTIYHKNRPEGGF